jgi:hypothetical protein
LRFLFVMFNPAETGHTIAEPAKIAAPGVRLSTSAVCIRPRGLTYPRLLNGLKLIPVR